MAETTAGFVLAGGRSSRMGSDKALLEVDGEALLARAAALVRAAAGRVAVVGSRERYERFGLPVVEDRRPGDGPLAGIEAALSSGEAAEWNLIVACDMPKLDADTLGRLMERAVASDADCVTAAGEPLCAVYRRRFLAVATRQLDAGRRKVRDAFEGLQVIQISMDTDAPLANVNTPAEWQRVAEGR